MNKMLISFILAVAVVLFHSCYYDKEELLYRGSSSACSDTVGTISYAQKIVPIFTSQCYYCHTGASPSGGILMGTYASDRAIAQNGKLYGTIAHASGFIALPSGSPQLSPCQIALIKKWIDAGMLNN